MADYQRRNKCERRIFEERNVFKGLKCGNPRWGWTNHMEPLCQECFKERMVVQYLLIVFSGMGNWGGLMNAHMERGWAKFQHGRQTGDSKSKRGAHTG